MRRRFLDLSGRLVNKIVFDDSIADPANITGDVWGYVIQMIRSKIRCCLAKKTGDGVAICYLDNNTREFYHDGKTVANLVGGDGDVMVFFPDIYVCYQYIDQYKFSYSFSLNPMSYPCIHISSFLLGCYEGYVSKGPMLSSVSGVVSSGLTLSNAKRYAKNKGIGYQLVDYDMNKIIAWLFYAIYGTRDCQSVCGNGLGGFSYECGLTNSLGNRDTDVSNGNIMPVNFLGLESCWCGKAEYIQGVEVDYPNIIIEDAITGEKRTVEFNGVHDEIIYPLSLINGENMDIIAATPGGDASHGYCDSQIYSYDSIMSFVRSGYTNNNGNGVVFVDGSDIGGDVRITHGSRLAYRGKITEISDISKFMSLPVL